ncbi:MULTISPECIES: fumarylacetoacetate hydrolase family protein [Comamonadaceae]|uniref:fumarylacetoacetate hydrolase family protein n=1 Tax=Comamonadaceae TaxID=80864 RepID=UPI002720FB8C|nr:MULTISPECIES: fumarylacetoacetate hydrolase family protein [Comamonadaceae]MDO9143492.1 fumarylacetoacetate hydrolase family protein [Rhodoferax sp.]MDP3884975.1 fumarylacetoacetate hydrolase family protein [Hydrogenophaga sp.]
MDNSLIPTLGEELFDALRQRHTVAPLTERHPDISVEDAYRISLHMLRLREASGERVIGKKIGVTSKPVQDMLGVFQPDFGFLTDAMQCADGATVSIRRTGLIQPKAEGEVAFMLKSDLQGPGVTRADVLAATAWVAPCFEIVDSRIRDWKIKIQDTVADNASCGVFVIGQQHTDPAALDLATANMQLWKNGQLAGSGLGSAVQGHPAEAVAWLANTLGAFDIPFKAGEIILSGSLAPLVTAVAGDRFTMQIEGLGGCSINFSD